MINTITKKLHWPIIDWSKIVPEPYYICPKCNVLIDNAHKAYHCGCQYCFDCLDQLTSKSELADCLKCGQTFESNVGLNFF